MKTWYTTSGTIVRQMLSGRSNVFLISNDASHILIDSGPGFMWKILQRRLDDLGVSQIDFLFLTHSHFDHTGNAAKIKETYHSKVIIQESESGFLSSGENVLPTGTNAFTRFLVKTFAQQFIKLARYRPCTPDITFKEKYDLTDSGFDSYLIHTPGHTEGSASIIIDHEIALVGDTMFGVFPGSVFPPFAGNPGELIHSWNKLLDTGCNVFIPSHGSANKRSLVEKAYKKRLSK